jgi:lysophospholipase L1-like esterase
LRTRCFDAERAAALICVLASVLTALTCASGSLQPRSAAAPSATPSVLPSPPAPEAGSSLPAAAAGDGSAADEPAEPGQDPARVRGLTLPRFFAALTGGERVRIVWLGDSHTAADHLPHALREPLQRRFGNGGPGFLAVGADRYRHGRVSVKSEGRWRREPASPASGARQDDGVFGLSGVRAVPVSADARTRIELGSAAVAGGARWELLFRAASGARIRVSLDAKPETRLDARSGRPGPAGSPIRRASFVSEAGGKLTVAAGGGAPELFGLIVESSAGGVVLDTLGINGARASTALAWDERAWTAELAARSPALVVVAYGTNEAAGSLPADRWQRELATLRKRIQVAAPRADCLLLGPIDMAGADGRSVPRVAELDLAAERAAADTGCGYFSLFRAMGADGAIARWAREAPPLAAPDRIHLMPRGYEKLGALLATELLEEYDRFTAAAAPGAQRP